MKEQIPADTDAEGLCLALMDWPAKPWMNLAGEEQPPEVNPAAVQAFVDRMVGGDGVDLALDSKDRFWFPLAACVAAIEVTPAEKMNKRIQWQASSAISAALAGSGGVK